jgi:hypothetical protein
VREVGLGARRICKFNRRVSRVHHSRLYHGAENHAETPHKQCGVSEPDARGA